MKLTAAERQRAYRQRLKENPEKYRLHKELNNLRLRVYRDNLKGQALENSREKNRIHVAKHRALKKAQGIISKKEPPKTRAAQEKKREYWRNKKREERRRTPREQKEVNKKRREQRRRKALQDAARKENDAYVKNIHDARRAVDSVGITVSGDGRCDSPGYNAKYCSYTLMHLPTHKILAMALV